ncbi:DinB family protein [Deinococcus soli (ex Cha et al. 2016)]|uniref:DinB-like domain-containing protein n=1 Tax=Deinococcus soli (ex Cha et al. 2016) TaxID=1309411 RepID=A0A0F7JPH8_9DEIO|nr:DinB family protein [Deinococcus soli (ex Cha et al. 2016)]AKH16500.1 hypothetical protein SY84_04880 [Deinococcus soli (ex Cha et al. 2016)]
MWPELRELFVRDLGKLIAELEAYPDDASVWRVRGDIVNPAGTLALHLIGNLSQFVAADLGGVPFVRDREAEFARRDVPRAELIAGLREVSARVVAGLDGLDEARLDEVSARQLPGFPEGMTTRYFLIHLYGHLNWHLGQVDYHRRMLD